MTKTTCRKRPFKWLKTPAHHALRMLTFSNCRMQSVLQIRRCRDPFCPDWNREKKQALPLNENVCVEIRRHYLQTPSISTLRTRKNWKFIFFEWFKQHFYLWWILDTCHARVFLVFRTFPQILQVWVTPVICFASTWFLMVVLSPSFPHTLHTHNFPQYCPFLITSCCVDVIIVSISSFNCFRRPPSLRARA